MATPTAPSKWTRASGPRCSARAWTRRPIRSTDHFAEVEEYFDGDITLQPQIGGRQLDRVSTNRMGDFNSIIAWPPAPKLDRFGKLNAKASAAERRGELL